MRFKSLATSVLALVSGAALCVGTAVLAVGFIENRSEEEVARTVSIDGQDWAAVEADGLQVVLTGTAPDEAARFRVLKLAGEVVDPARVIDRMEVRPAADIAAPEFLIEILRNDDGISLIGLIPAAEDRSALRDRLARIGGGAAEVTDLLETADYPKPDGWDPALAFALEALKRLPRSKISVAPDRVEVTAMADSQEEERQLESELTGMAPDTFALELDLEAPRPVITPFTLRFVVDPEGARFDACSADTAEARDRILKAAAAAGLTGEAGCTIGLGVPSPRWAEAAEAAIGTVAALGGGSVTFSDADITLVALEKMDQDLFDREVGKLEAALPEAFALHAVLPEPVASAEADQGPPEFVATRSPEGAVQMRGRLADERSRAAVESVSHGLFGVEDVRMEARLDPELPDGWSLRVLAGIEALGHLASGTLVVQPDFVEVEGLTGDREAQAAIAQILSDELGAAENFAIDVTYQEALDPEAGLPTPEECAAEIGAALDERQITFDPGSSQIDAASRPMIDTIADILRRCEGVPMEIAGHTDSQGRESMNLELSQERADAVLEALMARRLLTSNLTAVGYGEAVPIADNDTEAGREANRRIEFTLRLPEEEAAADEPAVPDAAAEPAQDETGAAPEPATGAEAEAAAAEEAPGADESD